MPRVIPKGGKRLIQVKVNLNEPEKETLDKLVKYFGSDSSRTLRQLLINWNDLEKYVVSLDEIISKVRDICLNNEDNLPSQILEKFQFLIESAKFLSEESSESDKFTKRKFLDKAKLHNTTEKPNENKAKIVILKLFDVDDGYVVIDHLQEGKCVICDFSHFNFNKNEISSEFNFLLGGIYGIRAKTEMIDKDIYIFTPSDTEIENIAKKKIEFLYSKKVKKTKYKNG